MHKMVSQRGGTLGVGLRMSTIGQGKAGIGCFSRERYRKRTVTRYCTGTLINATLHDDKELDKRYRDGVKSVSVNKL